MSAKVAVAPRKRGATPVGDKGRGEGVVADDIAAARLQAMTRGSQARKGKGKGKNKGKGKDTAKIGGGALDDKKSKKKKNKKKKRGSSSSSSSSGSDSDSDSSSSSDSDLGGGAGERDAVSPTASIEMEAGHVMVVNPSLERVFFGAGWKSMRDGQAGGENIDVGVSAIFFSQGKPVDAVWCQQLQHPANGAAPRAAVHSGYVLKGQGAQGGSVATWLAGLKMSQYASAFDEQGYDDMSTIDDMNKRDFANMLKAVGMKPGHKVKVKKYRRSRNEEESDQESKPKSAEERLTDLERVYINLPQVDQDTDVIVLVLHKYSGGDFTELTSANVRLVSADTNQELCSATLAGKQNMIGSAIILAKMYRCMGGWHMMGLGMPILLGPTACTWQDTVPSIVSSGTTSMPLAMRYEAELQDYLSNTPSMRQNPTKLSNTPSLAVPSARGTTAASAIFSAGAITLAAVDDAHFTTGVNFAAGACVAMAGALPDTPVCSATEFTSAWGGGQGTSLPRGPTTQKMRREHAELDAHGTGKPEAAGLCCLLLVPFMLVNEKCQQCVAIVKVVGKITGCLKETCGCLQSTCECLEATCETLGTIVECLTCQNC
jgi:stress response protein SCP2